MRCTYTRHVHQDGDLLFELRESALSVKIVVRGYTPFERHLAVHLAVHFGEQMTVDDAQKCQNPHIFFLPQHGIAMAS